ncbi:glycosyltransferase family 2 protein [Pseudoclavibacter helvolus]|uniref:glycosyltransferase family 2 protein n=1 Tax=Pseudoclavibacter helvolus TaxID=255205 RepID=UPI003C720793
MRETETGRPRVSVVYVAYRTPSALLNTSLSSVSVAAERADVDLEVLVADNGGLDREAISSAAKVIGDGKNLGFGEAVNASVAQAEGDFVLLMNPDSTLDADALSLLLAEAGVQAGPQLFNSLLLNGDRAQIHAYNLWWTSTSLFLKKRKFARTLEGWRDAARPVQVPRLCGAGLFGRRDVLVKLGPFDESFFLYGEDVDLSLRAKRAGVGLTLVPKSIIRHDAGGSSEGSSGLVQAARTDAHLRLLARHQPYALSLLGRLEHTAVTLLGVLTKVRQPKHAADRARRLREVARWGFHRDRRRFDPTAHSDHSGARAA